MQKNWAITQEPNTYFKAKKISIRTAISKESKYSLKIK